MSMFDIFTKTTPDAVQQQPQQPGVTPPGNIPDQQVAATQQSAVTDANGVIPAGNASPDSPLAGFKDLWETKPTDPNAPTPAVPQSLTAEQIQGVVANASFTQSITPEMNAAIAEGGEGAQVAFHEAMNAVAKNVMVQSTLVNDKLMEKKIAAALASQQEGLPAMLRSQQVADSNPLFKDPAVQPIMEATTSQLMNKFPNATPAEINTMTQKYIVAMAEAMNPTVNATAADGGTDWDAFLQAPT
jgi:hypothetical protein